MSDVAEETFARAGVFTRGTELPADAALEIIDTSNAFEALHHEWEALQSSSAAAHNVFQTYAWCAAWYERYGADTPGVELHVIVGRHRDRVVMIWPTMRVRHGPVSIIKWLSDPFAQYGDVLIANDCDKSKWLDAAWQQMTHADDIDGIALRYVREDAAVHGFLRSKCRTVADENEAPYLDLTAFGSADDYSKSLSRNQRSQRSKLRKKLERTGDMAFDVYRDGARFKWAIDEALRLKRQWLEEHGFKADILTGAGFDQFFNRLGRGEDSELTAAAGVLSRDGTPISIDLGFHYKNQYFGYLLVQDQALLELSPVKVHLDHLQKWTVENGFKRFDLMIPSDPYKQHWASDEVQVRDFAVPTGVWGFAYCNAYLGWIRPRLKRLYHATPAQIRRPIIDLLSRRNH